MAQNRLIHQTSPYLLQHAHNPVDWYAWGEEALQKAKTENKPILVSIGYAACHWCHVMEKESFEDPTVAKIMNQYFVNIKIDREERPDIDAIYMDAVQVISGSGGWPLNVFLTPDAKPFYGGTYFPPVKAFNRSSWSDVLQSIIHAWQEKPSEIIAQAENLTEHILKGNNIFDHVKNTQTDFEEEQLKAITELFLKYADKQSGGFGKAPKFPQTFSIQFLLRQFYFTQNEDALNQALLSLNKMIYGGLYDQLGGGFSRYCTDDEWQIPHFEKMLYDNALLVSVISEAFQLTGDPLYRKALEQTMSFIQREWQSPEGGFYTAYDADSEGVEGKFYTWSKKEIVSVLGNDAELFCHYYQVTDEGNWEHTNILWAKETLKDFCILNKINEKDAILIFDNCRRKLLTIRERRIKPLLDDKIILGWNALMITACCKAYAALLDDVYIQMAEKTNIFIEIYMKNDKGNFCHNYKKEAANPAFLDDWSYYIQALIHLSEATGKNEYLHKAKLYTEKVLKDFSDEQTSFFFYTPVWQTDTILRKKEWYDGATPSGNSIMAWNLYYLSIIFDIKKWKMKSIEMTKTVTPHLLRYPTSFANWACLFQQLIKGTHEIVVSGTNSHPVAKNILTHYCPNKVLQHQCAPTEGFPLLHNRWNDVGKTQIFLCKNYSCQMPVDTTEEFWQLLKE